MFFFKKKRSEGNERQNENPSTTGSRLSTKKKAPKWVTEMTEPKKTRNKNDPSKKKTSLPPSFVFFSFWGFFTHGPAAAAATETGSVAAEGSEIIFYKKKRTG